MSILLQVRMSVSASAARRALISWPTKSQVLRFRTQVRRPPSTSLLVSSISGSRRNAVRRGHCNSVGRLSHAEGLVTAWDLGLRLVRRIVYGFLTSGGGTGG